MKRKSLFSSNLNVFYLMRLVAKSYFKNSAAIFTDFVLPIIIMSVLYNILSKNSVSTLVPGIILAPIASSSFISFAVGMVEWRSSVFMKKIKVSQISIIQFFFSFIIFFLFISLLTFIVGLVYTIFLEQVGVKELEGVTEHLKSVNWGYGILGILLLILTTLSLGFVIAFSVQRTNAAIAICLTIFLVQAFLLGYYLPIFLVSKKWMQIVSWLLPFYAPSRIFQVAWLEDLKIVTETKQTINVFKDWQIVDLEQLGKRKFEYIDINFHQSYWSLVLVSLAWMTIGFGTTVYLDKYKKFN